MTAIPLLRVNSFLPFVKFLNRIGSPTERLLRQAKLPIFALEDPEALFPVYQVLDFTEQAASFEKADMLGIWVGQQAEIADLGMFGQVVLQTLTLYELLKTVERMIATLNSNERMWLVETGDSVWVNHQLVCPPSVKNQQATLYALMLYLKAVQLAAGPEWRPANIRFQCNYSKKFTEVAEFANAQLHFNQPNSAIAIPKSLLSLPLRSSKASHGLSTSEYRQRLQTTAPSENFSGSLQQLLQTLLQDGYPDIRLAAEASGLSVRSFQRRLAEANLNYSRIVEQVRFDRAIQLLYDPQIQLIDIALDLGYTDAANFTRAFKRWAGVSPREFRRLHVQCC